MNCDMCGTTGQLFRTIVEGSQLAACKSCSQYGKVVGRIAPAVVKKEREVQVASHKPEIVENVVDNFGALIKQKRESLGMDFKTFAQKIAEKESILQKYETGNMKPTLDRAHQLQKLLSMKLTEEVIDEPVEFEKSDVQLTLGDMIKIKTKKSK